MRVTLPGDSPTAAENSPARIVSLMMTPRQVASLIDAHAAALRLYARQWTVAPDDAVQEAFGRLMTTTPDDPVAWLYRVTRNAAIDAGKAESRRKRREQVAAKPERWFAEAARDGLDAATAVAALEALPAELREVIVARLWGGLTLDQIAVASGCSVSTAHRRYEAGVAALRERLGVACPKM